jgi:uncharacterized membrane protein YkvI
LERCSRGVDKCTLGKDEKDEAKEIKRMIRYMIGFLMNYCFIWLVILACCVVGGPFASGKPFVDIYSRGFGCSIFGGIILWTIVATFCLFISFIVAVVIRIKEYFAKKKSSVE